MSSNNVPLRYEHVIVPSSVADLYTRKVLPLFSQMGANSPWNVKSWLYYELPPSSPVTVNSTLLEPFFSALFEQRMAPAVKLSDTLLERAKPFLLEVYSSPEIRCKLSGRSTLDSSWKATRADIDRFDKVIRELKRDDYRLCFLPQTSGEAKPCLSETTMVRDVNPHATTTRIFTGVSSRLLNLMLGPKWHEVSQHAQRVMQVALALTLIEQFAHVIWMKRWIDQYKAALKAYFNGHASGATPAMPMLIVPPEPITTYGSPRSNLGIDISYYLFGLEMQLTHREITVIDNRSRVSVPILNGSAGLEAGIRDLQSGRTINRWDVAPDTIRAFLDYRTWLAVYPSYTITTSLDCSSVSAPEYPTLSLHLVSRSEPKIPPHRKSVLVTPDNDGSALHVQIPSAPEKKKVRWSFGVPEENPSS